MKLRPRSALTKQRPKCVSTAQNGGRRKPFPTQHDLCVKILSRERAELLWKRHRFLAFGDYDDLDRAKLKMLILSTDGNDRRNRSENRSENPRRFLGHRKNRSELPTYITKSVHEQINHLAE